MILHPGADGGLHDVAATSIVMAFAWAAVGVNAAIYWVKQAISHWRSKKSLDSSAQSR